MGSKRTAWHFFFCLLLRRYGPSMFEVRDEVRLSEEPPRIDYLLLRRTDATLGATAAQTLVALWPLLPLVTIAELKSIGRRYGRGELDRLWSYAHAYYAAEHASLAERSHLATLLLVPGRTPTLDIDVEKMGLVWESVGAGYWRLTGGLFALYVVEIDVVADQPDEDLLALYSHHQVRTPRATRFWGELTGAEANMVAQNLEGYEEEIKNIVSALPLEQRLTGVSPEQLAACLSPEQRLAGLSPEQIAARLSPEQRLAGLPPEQLAARLSPEQIVLSLPDDALRALSADYLSRLSPDTLAAIRRRLGQQAQ
jgi:hypothetical protein